MVRPRFSLRGLMVLVLVAAVVLVALRFASEACAGAVLLALQVVLGLAILTAVYRRGARRAFWLGFALFGWGYLLQVVATGDEDVSAPLFRGFCGVAAQYYDEEPPQPVLSTALDAAYPLLHQRPAPGSGFPFLSWFTRSGPRDRLIHSALERPISMPFGKETTLEDLIKYIKLETESSELLQGIPVYVDPAGLQEAEKTMQSMIALELDGVPLRTSLELALRQIDLKYEVRDGLLQITYVVASVDPDADHRAFQRVGHSGFALLFAVLGGLAGRAFQVTGSRALPVPRE